jgi:membrane protease YdiL (CAAX protease family)
MGSAPQEVLSQPAPEATSQLIPAGARWCALAFAMCFPGVMAWLYFMVLAEPLPGDPRPPAAAFPVYVLSKIAQFSFPLLWVWHFERFRLHAAPPSFRGLAFGLGFALLVAVALFVAYFGYCAVASFWRERQPTSLPRSPSFTQVRRRATSYSASLSLGAHSFLEEYYWRWFVFGELRRLMAVTPALVLSSLAFMAHHVVVLGVYLPLMGAVPLSLCVAVGGGVWAWIYHRSGSICCCWLSHLLVDAAILAVGYDMVFVLPR